MQPIVPRDLKSRPPLPTLRIAKKRRVESKESRGRDFSRDFFSLYVFNIAIRERHGPACKLPLAAIERPTMRMLIE